MKIRNLISFLAISAFSVTGYSLDIQVEESGTLSELLKDATDVTNLKVSGNINAADLFYLSEIKGISTLDLSDAVIGEYNNLRLRGKSQYDANTIPSGCFAGSQLTSVSFPVTPGLIIGEAAFTASNLQTLEIPASVDSIGTGAFAACDGLTTVTLPVCRMGKSVFADCTGLETVNVGNATVIAPSTFKGCTALVNVAGAEKIVKIGAQAFEGDKSLTVFNFGRKLTEIGESAFASTGLLEANLYDATNLKTLPSEVFADAALTSIALPDGLTDVGNAAFFGNGQLQSVILPSETITLGEHAFKGTDLSELELPEKLEEIGAYALLGQTGIKDLTLPSTLIFIGDHAMEGMTGLQSINVEKLGTAVPELGESVWEGVNQQNVKLVVDEYFADYFQNADQWKDFSFDITSGTDDIISDNTADTGIKGRFVGTELQVVSTNSEIDVLRLYDLSGRLLISVEPHDTVVNIDTADFNGNVFLINVSLENRKSAALKLGRR